MLSQSFFPNFGQGPFPKIAGKGPGLLHRKVSLAAVNKMYVFLFHEATNSCKNLKIH